MAALRIVSLALVLLAAGAASAGGSAGPFATQPPAAFAARPAALAARPAALAARPAALAARPAARHGTAALPRPGSAEALRRFRAARALEARVRLRELSRDAARRIEEHRVRRHGSVHALDAHRRRARAEEELDALAFEHALDALERRARPAYGRRELGPVTRRVLAAGGIRLRRVERRHALEQRLRALERELGEHGARDRARLLKAE